MKDILKKLLNSKQELYDVQQLFTKTLETRYQSLTKESTNDLKKDINEELEFSLSSTIRVKSGRIVIKAPKLVWQEEIILTRVPGLKCPHKFYAAFNLIDIEKILENGDVVVERESGKEKILYSSILKESEIILQDKLKIFYEQLQKAIEWKNILEGLIHSRWDDIEENTIKVKKSWIKIFSEHFQFLIYDSKSIKIRGKKSEDEYDKIESDEIIEYKEGGWEKKSSPKNQKPLLILLEDFDLFDKALLNAEKSKKRLMNQGRNILTGLKKCNKPARLLNQLMKT